MPRCAALSGQTPVRRLLPSITALGVVSILATGCLSEAQWEAQEPEIPSRQEVFEQERRQRPATEAQLTALAAYRDEVCERRSAAEWVEETHGRSCRFNNSFSEIQALETLRKASIGSSDEPRILDRMISIWAAVYTDTQRECFSILSNVKISMTVGEVEDAQSNAFKLKKLREMALEQPEKLCLELARDYPDYQAKSTCPGKEAAPLPPPRPVVVDWGENDPDGFAEPAEPRKPPASRATDEPVEIRPPWEPPAPASSDDSGWF